MLRFSQNIQSQTRKLIWPYGVCFRWACNYNMTGSSENKGTCKIGIPGISQDPRQTNSKDY